MMPTLNCILDVRVGVGEMFKLFAGSSRRARCTSKAQENAEDYKC